MVGVVSAKTDQAVRGAALQILFIQQQTGRHHGSLAAGRDEKVDRSREHGAVGIILRRRQRAQGQIGLLWTGAAIGQHLAFADGKGRTSGRCVILAHFSAIKVVREGGQKAGLAERRVHNEKRGQRCEQPCGELREGGFHGPAFSARSGLAAVAPASVVGLAMEG